VSTGKIEVPLRAVIDKPPPGVSWALQLSKGDLSRLATPVSASAERLVFEFSIQAERAPDGSLRLLGPGVQGPPQGRFFYLNSGTYAGQAHPIFGRRAKIPLAGLTWMMIEGLKPGQRLEVRIPGAGKDGGPTCASVKLPPDGWRVL
jgi:hypothetical protein